MHCNLCEFNNPKGTATAVIISSGRLLMLKRNEEPYLGEWDLPGGYMCEGDMPEQTLKNEIKEELGVECRLDFIGWFPGTSNFEGKSFSIISHAYLAEVKGEIMLDKKENSEYKWVDIDKINTNKVAFDSNQDIVKFVKENFSIDLSLLNNLIKQLDDSATIKEVDLYKSILCGYMSKKIVDGKLVGVGWIYPRRTLLRKQAVIEDVVVDESARGKGYGKDITLDLISWAKKKGVEVIELTSGSHRIAANNLYKKMGFKLHPTNHYLYKIN